MAQDQDFNNHSPIPEDRRWPALLARDAAGDGQFVYAVRTTGVYCRPSCSARRPRPENVVFFARTSDAEAAGYRPCKRCKPDGPSRDERHTAIVAAACRLIEQADEAPSVDRLAAESGMSRSHFQRVFKAVTGITPRAYAEANRARRVRDGLPDSRTVTDAIYEAGFNSNGRFYSTSKSMLGMRPTAYRNGGEGETIRFAAGECSLGAIVVAATGRGICAILLGDDPEQLVRDLEDQFPRAELQAGGPDFDAWMAAVVGFVDDPGTGLELPLDIRGTAFQQRVWQALTAIPPGSTATYAEIAERAGAPGSARAVARACASNQIAVAIPCHRVVRADGSLSGYRWGVERKAALLERERERSEGGNAPVREVAAPEA